MACCPRPSGPVPRCPAVHLGAVIAAPGSWVCGCCRCALDTVNRSVRVSRTVEKE